MTASLSRRTSRLLDGTVIDDAKVFNNKLREWEDYYNYHRPHGPLGGQTPYERLRTKSRTPVQPVTVSCTRSWCVSILCPPEPDEEARDAV